MASQTNAATVLGNLKVVCITCKAKELGSQRLVCDSCCSIIHTFAPGDTDGGRAQARHPVHYKNKARLLIHAAAVDRGLVSTEGRLRWKHSASLRQAVNLLGESWSTLQRMLMKPLPEYVNDHHNLARQLVPKFPTLDVDICKQYRWFVCQRTVGNSVSNAP